MKFSSWNIICFGQKESIKVQFFRLLSALMKVHPMPHAVFETTRLVFVQILHHCPVSWNISLLYFCSSNQVYFGRKEPIKNKFLEFWVLGGKLFKLFMSYLKPQVCFSSNFASLFSVTRCNSSVLFYLKLYMIWTNEPKKVQNFSLLIAQVKFHQTYTLIGIFCWKYTKFQLRKCRGFMSHDTEDWCKIRRKTELLFPKWHKFGEFWREHSKFSKFSLWSVQRNYLSWHWRVMEYLRKNWLVVWKMTWGIFSPEHLKNLKILTLMGSFYPK